MLRLPRPPFVRTKQPPRSYRRPLLTSPHPTRAWPSDVVGHIIALEIGDAHLLDAGAAEVTRRITWVASRNFLFPWVMSMMTFHHECGSQAITAALVLHCRAFVPQGWSAGLPSWITPSSDQCTEVALLISCLENPPPSEASTASLITALANRETILSVYVIEAVLPLLSVPLVHATLKCAADRHGTDKLTNFVPRRLCEGILRGVTSNRKLLQRFDDFHECFILSLKFFRSAYSANFVLERVREMATQVYIDGPKPMILVELYETLTLFWPEARPLPRAIYVGMLKAPYRMYQTASPECWKKTIHFATLLLKNEPRAFKVALAQGDHIAGELGRGTLEHKQYGLLMWRVFVKAHAPSEGIALLVQLCESSEHLVSAIIALRQEISLLASTGFAKKFLAERQDVNISPEAHFMLSSAPFSLVPAPAFWWRCGCSDYMNVGTSVVCYSCKGYTCLCGRMYPRASDIASCPTCQRKFTWAQAADVIRAWHCDACNVVSLQPQCRGCGAHDKNTHRSCPRCRYMNLRETLCCSQCGEITQHDDVPLLADCKACSTFHVPSAACGAVGEPRLFYFTWQCGCGAQNPPSASHCYRCGPGCFSCAECGVLQTSAKALCGACGADHPRTVARHSGRLWWCPSCEATRVVGLLKQQCTHVRPILFADSKWHCHSCGVAHDASTASRSSCRTCHAMRPHGFSERLLWDCTFCHQKRQRGFRCSRCHHTHKSVSAHVWACGDCNRLNPSWSEACAKCSKRRHVETAHMFEYVPWKCEERACRAYNKGERAGSCVQCRVGVRPLATLRKIPFAESVMYKKLFAADGQSDESEGHVTEFGFPLLAEMDVSCDWLRPEGISLQI